MQLHISFLGRAARWRAGMVAGLMIVVLGLAAASATTPERAAVAPNFRALYFLSGGEIWQTTFGGEDAVVLPTSRTPLQQRTSPVDGTIIYTWQVNGDSDHNQLAIITPAGEEKFLPGASDEDNESFVAVSATRAEFFFSSDRDGTESIYRASTDLSVIEPVTEAPADTGDTSAMVSPDGEWLLVQRRRFTGTPGSDTFVVNREGGAPLAQLRLAGQVSAMPAGWGPDSSTVFFSTEDAEPTEDAFEMVRAQRDGSDRDVIGTVPDIYDTWSTPASVSPDGMRLMYSLGNDLYLQTLPATTRTDFAVGPGFDDGVRGWSPDGSIILIESREAGTDEWNYIVYDFEQEQYFGLADSVENFGQVRPLWVGPRQVLHMERTGSGSRIYLNDLAAGFEKLVYEHDAPTGWMAAGPVHSAVAAGVSRN